MRIGENERSADGSSRRARILPEKVCASGGKSLCKLHVRYEAGMFVHAAGIQNLEPARSPADRQHRCFPDFAEAIEELLRPDQIVRALGRAQKAVVKTMQVV